MERLAHGFGGLLDLIWSLPAAARLNRVPLASLAVLALAGLAFAVGNGGLGVPGAARAGPVIGDVGPGVQPTVAPPSPPKASGSLAPTSTQGFTFQPIDAPSASPGG